MPYIKKKDREAAKDMPVAAGDLAYAITQLLLDNLFGNYAEKLPRYQDYATATGVLELTKLELWRRLIVPYEDAKIKENGDVY